MFTDQTSCASPVSPQETKGKRARAERKVSPSTSLGSLGRLCNGLGGPRGLGHSQHHLGEDLRPHPGPCPSSRWVRDEGPLSPACFVSGR